MDFDERKVQLGVLILCVVLGTIAMLWPAIAALVIYGEFVPEVTKVFFTGARMDPSTTSAIMDWSIAIGSMLIGIGYLVFNQSAKLRRLLKGVLLTVLIYVIAYGIFYSAALINYGRH